MPATPPSLKTRALRLLSTREHSREELRRKLERFEEQPDALTRTLDELQAKGFINEQRVMDSVIHRRAPKLGTARIKQELRDKGLDPDAIAATLAELEAGEHERALAVWRKKFSAPATDASEAARQMRFLATRGFSAELIRRLVKFPASA